MHIINNDSKYIMDVCVLKHLLSKNILNAEEKHTINNCVDILNEQIKYGWHTEQLPCEEGIYDVMFCDGAGYQYIVTCEVIEEKQFSTDNKYMVCRRFRLLPLSQYENVIINNNIVGWRKHKDF